MDLAFSAAEVAFRDEVRTWLRENAPRDTRPHEPTAIRDYDLAWQRTQWEAGWAGIAWPKEYGGRGLSLVEQLIWHEEYARAGLPAIDGVPVPVIGAFQWARLPEAWARNTHHA